MQYQGYGVTQVIMSTQLQKENTLIHMRIFKKLADELGLKAEVFIHGNKCGFNSAIGRCIYIKNLGEMIDKKTFKLVETDLVKEIGWPNKSGTCFRWCSLPSEQLEFLLVTYGYNKVIINRILKFQKDNPNGYFAYYGEKFKQIQEIGFYGLKIAGREYPTNISYPLVKAYRNLLDNKDVTKSDDYLKYIEQQPFSMAVDNANS